MTTMKNPSIASGNEVTDGQVETCVTLVTDATRKSTGVALRELSKAGVLTKQNIEKVRARGDQIVAAITELVKQKFAELAENVSGCLKLISGAETITLKPTDGKESIAKARNLFLGWLDSDFKMWGLDMESGSTMEMNVTVHELIKAGDYRKIFGSLSDDPKKLCLTQPQIIQFVKNHRKWLSENWTFFLFEANGELFVADVNLNADGNLLVHVNRFSNDFAWSAEDRRRIVVPQLTN